MTTDNARPAQETSRERIKTPFAKIIVSGKAEKPYYNIMYFDLGEMYIGFGSYKLELVQKWLREEFDVRMNDDVVPVVRCRDCKYWGDEHGTAQSSDGVLYARCRMHNHAVKGLHIGWAPRKDDFCSCGERKEAREDFFCADGVKREEAKRNEKSD